MTNLDTQRYDYRDGSWKTEDGSCDKTLRSLRQTLRSWRLNQANGYKK